MSAQQQAINKAIAILDSVKAKYKVILVDGTEYGELEIAKSKKKRHFKNPYGERSAYVKDSLRDVSVGEAKEIPFTHYDADSIRSSLCAYASKTWGNDTYTTAVDKVKGVIEIFRFR